MNCILAPQKPRPSGYATTSRGHGTCFLVHRLAWEDAYGPIPEGLEIHHLCGTKNCINIDHLALVTREAHAVLGRKEVCARGHNLATERRITPAGGYYCRSCNRERQRERRAHAREAS